MISCSMPSLGMAVSHFPVIAVQPYWVRADEAMGSKDKFWVDRPDEEHPWLFKFSRKNVWGFAGEHWSEKIAAEVAQALGIPHALVELAEYKGHPGALVRKFPELAVPGTVLEHGNTLLPGLVVGYDRSKRYGQREHTLINVLRVISKAFPGVAEGRTALAQFMGYLILDALVMNTDRHHENWALLRQTAATGPGSTHLAPTFDHASSLGRELTTVKLQAWARERQSLARYVDNARCPIYRLSADQHGINPIAVVSLALRITPDHVIPWLHRLRNFDPQGLVDITARVPPSIMGEDHRNFAAELLCHTLQRLQRLHP